MTREDTWRKFNQLALDEALAASDYLYDYNGAQLVGNILQVGIKILKGEPIEGWKSIRTPADSPYYYCWRYEVAWPKLSCNVFFDIWAYDPYRGVTTKGNVLQRYWRLYCYATTDLGNKFLWEVFTDDIDAKIKLSAYYNTNYDSIITVLFPMVQTAWLKPASSLIKCLTK